MSDVNYTVGDLQLEFVVGDLFVCLFWPRYGLNFMCWILIVGADRILVLFMRLNVI